MAAHGHYWNGCGGGDAPFGSYNSFDVFIFILLQNWGVVVSPAPYSDANGTGYTYQYCYKKQDKFQPIEFFPKVDFSPARPLNLV
jgi:hypothetical protein